MKTDHNMPPLSLAIVTYNEEKNLARCLESALGVVSEIIIIDSGSTDRTTEIAAEYHANVFYNPWPGFVVQKNIAMSKCTQPWVISLDGDEALSTELRHSLLSLFSVGEPKHSGYWINRKNFYLGAWIEHAWYPEFRLRLARRDSASFEGADPHDKLSVKGTTGKLSGDILHFSYVDLQDHIDRTIHYGRVGAQTLIKNGKHFKWYKLVFSPWIRFVRSLVLKQAWRDGWRGWIIAYSSLLACFIKYAILFEADLKKNLKKGEECDGER